MLIRVIVIIILAINVQQYLTCFLRLDREFCSVCVLAVMNLVE